MKEEVKKKNKNQELIDLSIETKAIKYGTLGLVILAVGYFTMEIIVTGETNYGWYSLISIYAAIIYIYKAIKLSEKRALFIVLAIIYSLITILCTYLYIKDAFLNY